MALKSNVQDASQALNKSNDIVSPLSLSVTSDTFFTFLQLNLFLPLDS